MDSPETTKNLTSSSSSSPANQESPFFSYLRNLSPIPPSKDLRISSGLSELKIPTPPPVFTSPRLNSQLETNFWKRERYYHPSNSEPFNGHEDKSNIHIAGSDVFGAPSTKLMMSLVPCTQKVSERKGSMLVQSCSPSQYVNEYLTDPIEVDGANSSASVDLCVKEVNDLTRTSQSGCTSSKEAVPKLDDTGDIKKTDMEIDEAVKPTPLEQTNEEWQEKTRLLGKSGKQKDGEGQSDLISVQINDAVVSDSSLEAASGAHNCLFLETEDVSPQSVDCGQNGERGHKPEVLPEAQIVEAHENLNEHSGGISHTSDKKMLGNFEEDGQNKRGTRRRCLQFEAAEARRQSTSKGQCILNSSIIVPFSRLQAIRSGVGMLESSLDLATSGNNRVINSTLPMDTNFSLYPVKAPETDVSNFDGSIRNSENAPQKAPVRSGIGLHLNSIVNAAAMRSSAAPSMHINENDFPNTQMEKSSSLVKQHLLERKSSTLPTVVTEGNPREIQGILTESSASRSDSDQREIHAIITESSTTLGFPQEKADRFEELNNMSPPKKRKKMPYTIESEGCKRCNCRKSKCLKLYCECFAAGIYCAEPCACQGCFNKPEYEDTVLETRQHIESRNPLAFAPKVVRRVTGSPANIVEDDNRMTPSSARHKRGCNCKKSMCLKKYCECYQSGVGCSVGCRCEGCKNIYGAKEGYGEFGQMVYNKADNESWEDPSDSKYARPEHCHPHNLTPATPLFENSNHGKDPSKTRLPDRRYVLSPKSNPDNSSSSRSPRNSDTHDDRQAKTGEGSLDVVFYDGQMEFSATGRVDHRFSPWDGLEDICHLTPMPRPPFRVSSNSPDYAKVSRVQLQGSVRVSGSLRWRSSPITPIPQIDGNKLRAEPSDSGILEDDTPDILKDTITPIQAVKVSSPNQKRVSPPNTRLKEIWSSGSPGLRSGRKFVLQSISSFPPLTPFRDPKGSCSSDK